MAAFDPRGAVVGLSDLLAEAILSARSDAIIAADRDGIIRFWNPGAERLFGYSRDEAISRSLDLIIPARLHQRHWDGYRRVMETGKTRYGEGDVLSVPALRKDGATISVEFTVMPLQNDGQVIGMAAIMRDVTKRFDEMRALKRKLEEVAMTSAKKP
jgi:PAS domain S-box-containing protein